MRVIHVVPAISEEASGPSYSVLRLCESLIEEGEEITLAALDWETLASPPLFLRSFPLATGPRRLGRSPAMRHWLAEQASSHSLDLIHNHSLWMMPNVYSGQIARKYRVPLMISPRGTLSEWALESGSWVKKMFWPILQKPSLAAVTCFHATAESEYEDIQRMGFRKPVAVIPNGIDIPLFRNVRREEIRTLLFLGRLHPIKGVDILLRAWQVVAPRFRNWQLEIVGPDNGGYLAIMRALASDLGLERVEFKGPLRGDEKWNAYRRAALFVLPTHSENFGMAVAEALAAGTPVIVSKGAPWAGLEKHGAGWWIDIGLDPLVACLLEALESTPDALAQMGFSGRRWMEAEFSWVEASRKMTATYHWLLNGGVRPKWVIQS